MRTENLLFVPTSVKVFALTILTLAIAFSAGLTTYYIFWIDAEANFVLASLSIFQATTSAAAIALIFFFSRRSLGRKALLKETTKWLTCDLRESLEIIDLPFDPDPTTWTIDKEAADLSRASVKIEHLKGGSVAHYLVSAFDVNIFFRITLNSHRFIILYYIPSESEDGLKQIANATEIVASGARLLNYETKYVKSEEFVQIYFFREVKRNFLVDSSERLFWSQDIATMTRSLILQLKKNSLISKDSGLTH